MKDDSVDRKLISSYQISKAFAVRHVNVQAA
jgi:hypothetical protein